MQVKLLFSILNYKVCTCLSFSFFFFIFGRFLEALGFLLAALWSLCRLFWRAGFILLGAFGSPGLSVGPLCYLLWCLWLVWASFLGYLARALLLNAQNSSIFDVFRYLGLSRKGLRLRALA